MLDHALEVCNKNRTTLTQTQYNQSNLAQLHSIQSLDMGNWIGSKVDDTIRLA